MPRAQAALAQHGYVQRTKARRPLAMQAHRSGEIQMVGQAPQNGLVELHYGVFAGEWLHRAARVDEHGVRNRLEPLTVIGRPAFRLSSEDSLIQLAVHLVINHQMAHPGVRGLLDIVLEARARPPDWSALVARAREWRLATVVWLALALADELLGFPEARLACTQLAPSPVRQVAMQCFVSSRTVLARRNLTRLGLLRFVYQLLLVDRLRDAARLVRQALWPEDEWLAARYGQCNVQQRWRHLWAAVRAEV
jgi:hypothetical protein